MPLPRPCSSTGESGRLLSGKPGFESRHGHQWAAGATDKHTVFRKPGSEFDSRAAFHFSREPGVSAMHLLALTGAESAASLVL